MAFQVREFQFEAGEDHFLWNFKLANINNSQLDFYSQEASSRSLSHLAQDISGQIEQALEKKHKKQEPKHRPIRKLCQKMLKELKINLESFCEDIGEDSQVVKDYFGKSLSDSTDVQRMESKCKKWILSIWAQLSYYYNQRSLETFFSFHTKQLIQSPQDFYATTHRYMQALLKGGKRVNPDFEALNEIYVITFGDNFKELPECQKQITQNLVLIDINLNVNEQYISQSLLWDADNLSNINIKTFSSYFLKDLLVQRNIELDREPFMELEKDIRIQMRAQILYKSLLKRYAPILLNFSSMDLPNETKEYMIPINLKLVDDHNNTIFQDSFQWDILNETNNVQQFVKELVDDCQIDPKYLSQLCYKMRSQINEELQWKFELLIKTFRSIHKDRESPKLNTQTIQILKKNVAYSMDVSLPSTDQNYQLNQEIYFNNSDLFSLLSRHMDILPEEFQQILMCKQTKNPQEKDKEGRLSKQTAEELLKKQQFYVENNPYLASVGNNNHLHTLWRKVLQK